MKLAAMFVALVALFPGSAAAGVWLAQVLAPGSRLAEVAGFFALPVAFAFSMQAWYGLALFGLIAQAVRWLVSGTRPRGDIAAPLRGSIVFLPISSAIGGLAGLVVGLLSSAHPVGSYFSFTG
jgi:hypothetical protein